MGEDDTGFLAKDCYERGLNPNKGPFTKILRKVLMEIKFIKEGAP